MCDLAATLLLTGKNKESGEYYQRARDIGAAHGFFSAECQATPKP